MTIFFIIALFFVDAVKLYRLKDSWVIIGNYFQFPPTSLGNTAIDTCSKNLIPMLQQRRGLYAGLFMLSLFFQACRQETDKDIPDVSDIEVEMNVTRFEKALFTLDTNQMATGLQEIEEKYPVFSQIYFERILGSKDPALAPVGHEAFVKGFINYPPVRHLYDTCMVLYGDFSPIEKQFKQAFQFYKYYFPDRPVPDITTFVSEYSHAAFIFGDNSLAVGLDFFLGENYPYQQYNPGNTNFSDYLIRSYNADHLVARTLLTLADDMVGLPSGNRMLDVMISNGKKLYLLDMLLPNAPDTVKMEVTPAQWQWLQENELEMWAFFLEENMLYNTSWEDIRKYVEYSPNSPGMPEEAPGRTANWLGWQIVKAYMTRFPDTTFQQLVELQDAQKLLDESKYKPRRR